MIYSPSDPYSPLESGIPHVLRGLVRLRISRIATLLIALAYLRSVVEAKGYRHPASLCGLGFQSQRGRFFGWRLLSTGAREENTSFLYTTAMIAREYWTLRSLVEDSTQVTPERRVVEDYNRQYNLPPNAKLSQQVNNWVCKTFYQSTAKRLRRT